MGVDEGRRAGEPRFEQDDREALVERGVDERDGAGHRFAFLAFGDEAEVVERRRERGGDGHVARSGEDQVYVPPGAAAEGIDEIDEHGRALALLPAAAVDDVGGAQAGPLREGGLGRLEGLQPHRDDFGDARGEAGHEAAGQIPLRLGVEEEPADAPVGGEERRDARVGLVVETRDEERLVRDGARDAPCQPEQIRPRQDAVVAGGRVAEALDERAGDDAVFEPREGLRVAERLAVLQRDLRARPCVRVARVDGVAAHRQAAALENAGRQLVGPRAVVPGAGAKQLDLVPEGGRVERERMQERLGAADGAGLVQAGGDDGDFHGRLDSSASIRALSAATSAVWRRCIVSSAASSTPLVWFCCDQRR